MVVIQSVSRALSILNLYSYARPSLSIAEMSRSLELAKGTVHNLVRTMEREGFLRQDQETRRYLLGPRILALGAIMAGTLEINQVAASDIRAMADKMNMVCRLAIWDHDAALVTLNAAPSYPEGAAGRIGPRVEAYCSSIGRLLLAHLDPEEISVYLSRAKLIQLTPKTITDPREVIAKLALIRERGWALNDQEMALGRASIAVAVRDSESRVVAALSLTAEPDRISEVTAENLLKELLPAADRLSRRMGYLPGVAVAGIRR